VSTIRVRFAPSPTGHLHIGSVRSAIFNWLFARHHQAIFLLRIEDTDVQRSTKAFLDSQLASLSWFGLMPDEPIVYQLSRQQEHLKEANRLIAEGKAYRCYCPPREADEVVHALEQGEGAKYSGKCRNLTPAEQNTEKPHAIRFKLPNGISSVTFEDVILGTVSVAADQLDDYVIIRRDGTPIYNFCVVVDDIFMEISHVIRGQDHVSNTPKQVLLYRALGKKEPLFAHIPLILGPTGAKLSKRDASVSVEEYRAQGYLAEALFNYLVRLGWSHGDEEVFTREQLVQVFDLDQVGKKGSIFDVKKLQWLNGVYLRAKSSTELLSSFDLMDESYRKNLQAAWPEQALDALLTLYKERAVTLVDLYQAVHSFAQHPVGYDCSHIAKWQTAQTPVMLQAFMNKVGALTLFDHDALAACANEICNEFNVKLVALAQPLRLALTGGTVSPGVFDIMAVLGKEQSLLRVQALCDALV
jgi:glutamyl-tRNA synthetase